LICFLQEKCNGKCNRDFKPVCASNGSTFNNACLLEFEACKAGTGGNITKVSEGPCPEASGEGKNDTNIKTLVLYRSNHVFNEGKSAEDKKETTEEVKTEDKAEGIFLFFT